MRDARLPDLTSARAGRSRQLRDADDGSFVAIVMDIPPSYVPSEVRQCHRAGVVASPISA